MNFQQFKLGAAVIVVSALAGLAISTDAEARRHHHGAHCRHGQIYRVSMGTCKSRRSFSRYARYDTREEDPPPRRRKSRPVQSRGSADPAARVANPHRPPMLQVVEPLPQKSQDALLEETPQQPERSTKSDSRCGETAAGVLLPNVPWYSAERSLMTIKPIGGFSWIVR